MSTINIILIALAIVVVWAVYAYNRFVSLTNRAQEAWADIDVQLKRRYDLIPNLIETVKGYASHESKTFQAVTDARVSAMNSTGTENKAQAENMLSSTLKSLFAVSEAYPDLKADQNFMQLQRELADTEDKIQASRRFYNTSVMTLNTAKQSFPGSIIASIFKFDQMDLFELGADEQAAKNPVKVKF